MKISITSRGSFNNTKRFLANAGKIDFMSLLNSYGQHGVAALSRATPIDTGLTSGSWGYEVKKTARGYTLTWTNSHVVDGVPIAIILQYGHGTGTGGYVQGQDYINPAIRPIFDKISSEVGKAVASA